MKKLIAVLLALVMLFALAACGNTTTGSETKSETKTETKTTEKTAEKETAAPAESGEVVINVALTADMGDMDPFAGASTGRNYMRYTVWEYLATYDHYGDPIEKMNWELAKNITMIDATTYEVEIYDYIVDALGNKVDANDIKYSFDMCKSQGHQGRVAKYVDHVDVIDDCTVRIYLTTNLNGSFAYILNTVCIVDQDTYEQYGDNMTQFPIGTGPYVVKECVSGSYYVLERNENYWQKPELYHKYVGDMSVDKFVYNVITEASQITIAVETNDVQVTTGMPASQISYFMNEDGTAKDGYSVNSLISSLTLNMRMNCSENSPFYNNPTLREALFRGFDAKGILDGVYEGRATLVHDLGTIKCTDYDTKWDEEDYFDYDPDKAAKLLEEAGYPGGKGLTVRFMVGHGQEDPAVLIKTYWELLGVNVDLAVLDDALFSASTTDYTQWDVLMCNTGSEGNVADTYTNVVGYSVNTGVNGIGILDEKLKQLTEEALAVDTYSLELVEELHDYVMDNCYARGILVETTYNVAQEGVEIMCHPWGHLAASACDFSEYLSK